MDKIILKKINNFKVKPLEDAAPVERKNQRGKKLFSMWCPNVYLVAKKASGKTTVAGSILFAMGGKYTKYILIVSTIDHDASWRAIVKKLGDRCVTFTEIVDEDGDNVIKNFLQEQDPEKWGDSELDEDQEEESQIGAGQIVPLNNFRKYQKMALEMEIEKSQKGGARKKSIDPDEEKKWKYPYPKYIIVMDDLGDSMRNKWVTQLLKTNRHYDTMVIASSQDLKDLNKPGRKNINYLLLFPKMSIDILKDIHKELMLSIDLEKFIEYYNKATDEKYSFLYIGRSGTEEEYRKGFDKKIED